jgi:hypothetical protein
MAGKDQAIESGATPVPRPRRLWPWFVGGFLLVFVGMLLLVNMIAMHPSGQYVVHSPLWHYYAISIPRSFTHSNLGPASGARLAWVETGLLHLLFSVLGGAAATAIGWWVRRLRGSREAAAGPRSLP